MTEQRIGNYIIEEPVGRGGMGVVYKGRHATLPRVVAIKSIDPHFRRDLRRLRHRFEREAFVQSQLDHPGIVKIYDYIVSELTYHIVMEYVEGHSLAEVLGKQKGRPLPVERALDLFEKILEAVAYAHSFVYRDEGGETRRGMIHRDLKPPNILVTTDDRIKVTDFGIVKLAGASESDTSGLIYGSPHYVSPEQAVGESVDQRSDVYSLGVILYEMLTGRPPFDGGEMRRKRTEVLRAHADETPRPPTEINPEISPALEQSILSALEKKPERRFHTSFDFWRAIRHARGRDTKEIDELEVALREPPERDAPDTGRLAGVTAEVVRDTFATQPMTQTFCDVCGTEADPDDSVCRACGLDLKASPATRNLTRDTRGSLRRSRMLWAVMTVATMLLVGLGIIYFARRDGENVAPDGRSAATVETGQAPADPAPPTASQPAAAPDAASALLKPARVRVDSSYDGYNAAPLSDGVFDVRQVGAMRYNQGNWVSSETSEPHWIQLDFGRPVRVTTVYVYWGFDRGRYMPSRRVVLQAAGDDGAWVTISELEPGENFDRAAFDIRPTETKSVRIYQPAQQGPANRPFVMWVREIQVYGAPASAR